MIEAPIVSADTLSSVLRDEYSLHASNLEFLPLGLDASAWSYHLDADGRSYYLKVRRAAFKPVGALMPAFLRSAGFENVIPPLPAADGRLWASLDGLTFVLYPFISGRRASDAGLSEHHWRDLGAFLKRLHATRLTGDIRSQVPRDQFVPAHLEQVRALNAGIASFRGRDSLQGELAALWLENRSSIAPLVDRTSALSAAMLRLRPDLVLCHADIHPANMLIGDDGRLYVVDWDESVLAPPARDLVYILAEADSHTLEFFAHGYGPVQLHPVLQAYYSHLWCLEDVGAFAEEALNLESGLESRRNSLEWFERMFTPGGTVESTLHMPLE